MAPAAQAMSLQLAAGQAAGPDPCAHEQHPDGAASSPQHLLLCRASWPGFGPPHRGQPRSDSALEPPAANSEHWEHWRALVEVWVEMGDGVQECGGVRGGAVSPSLLGLPRLYKRASYFCRGDNWQPANLIMEAAERGSRLPGAEPC